MASGDISIKEIYNTGRIKRSKKYYKLYENNKTLAFFKRSITTL
jgi:hypothetical protein